MLLLTNRKRTRFKRPVSTGWVRRTKIIGGVAAAAVTVPAHGFIVGSAGNGLMSATADIAPSPVFGWLRSFLGACAWAFMIAAGSLVYSHFVKKWHAKGYPILPVAAMAATDNLQPRSGAIPLGSGSKDQHARPRREAPTTQTSFLDEYEG